MTNENLRLAEKLGVMLLNKNMTITTAESCTGGLISATLTEISGSSSWFNRAYITYSNEAKHDMIGVKNETLDKYGAVSGQTVLEMIIGALEKANADIAVAVSGIAGPTGGTEEKPVGTVYIGWLIKGREPLVERFKFNGNRQEVRLQTVNTVLSKLVEIL